MLFLAFVLLAILLQVCHRRLLRQLLPDRFGGLTAALILLHAPLVLYMTIRLSGHGAFLPWLRPLARAGANPFLPEELVARLRAFTLALQRRHQLPIPE